jgi:hypothetical protein
MYTVSVLKLPGPASAEAATRRQAQAGTSRKGNIVLIVPLDPAYPAMDRTGHLPVNRAF